MRGELSSEDDDEVGDDGDLDFIKSKKKGQGKKGETPFEEQQRIKDEFRRAVKDFGEEDENDLFQVKEKQKGEEEDEEKEFKKYLKQKPKEEKELLKRFWGNEE